MLVIVFNQFISIAQSAVGKWDTYDEKSGLKESTMEFYKKGDRLYGKIIKLHPVKGMDVNKVCTKCTDERKGKRVEGMEVFRDLKWDGSAWVEGKALHPDHGKEYGLKVWIDPSNPNVLKVRGYLGPFFATQSWIRSKD